MCHKCHRRQLTWSRVGESKRLNKQRSADMAMSPAGLQRGTVNVDLHSGITSIQGPLKDRLHDMYRENSLQECVNLAWDTLPALPTTNASQTLHRPYIFFQRGVQKKERGQLKLSAHSSAFSPSQSQHMVKEVKLLLHPHAAAPPAILHPPECFFPLLK